MKCLFKYGIYQSSLNYLVIEYNRAIETLEKIGSVSGKHRKLSSDFRRGLEEMGI